MRDTMRFFAWCSERGFDVMTVNAIHLAGYRESLKSEGLEPASVKRHFSALRMLYAWWVEKGVLVTNPVREVKTEKVSRQEGKTPAFELEDMQKLFASFDTQSVVGLRDRALIAVMAYTFARVGAAVALDAQDYYAQGRHTYLRLEEKGGKQRVIPCPHKLEEYLDAYSEVAGITNQKGTPLFRSTRARTRQLTSSRMSRTDAYAMIRRRTEDAGIPGVFGCHSFRATGITTYLSNGGTIERAQFIAGHANVGTTQLYDKRNQRATLEDLERVRY